MSFSITEIATLPVKPDLDFTVDGEAKEALLAALSVIQKSKGCQRIFWGRQLEHPNLVDVAIDWETEDDFKGFATGENYAPFQAKAKIVAAGPAAIITTQFKTPFKDIATKSILELATAYYGLDVDEKAAGLSVSNTLAVIQKEAPAALGLTWGWIAEEVEHEKVEGKARAGLAVIAWNSVEEQTASVVASPEIQQALGALTGEVKHIDIRHTTFQLFEQ